jgi:hypothetical protein
MVDLFALALSHALLALAAWRLVLRDDLDADREAGRAAGRRKPGTGPGDG